MPQPVEIVQCPCPTCSSMLTPPYPGGGRVVCPQCRWTGEIYLFKRFPLDTAAAESALPEDATCIHHPTKKATAICAGSGDYICSLCAVEVNGETFSAEYLNKAGKAKFGKAFDRYLPRPDSVIYLLAITILIPGVDYVTFPLACVWIPYAFFLYFKALRMRRENDLFRIVMPRYRMVTIPIYLTLIGLAWLGVAIAVLVAVLSRRS